MRQLPSSQSKYGRLSLLTEFVRLSRLVPDFNRNIDISGGDDTSALGASGTGLLTWAGNVSGAHTFTLTGNVAIQASAPRRTAQPARVMTQRRRRLWSLVLMPAKNSTTA